MPEEETTQNSSDDDVAQDDEESAEDLEQDQQEGQSSGFSLTGPEAIAMLFLAGLFDLAGWFCLVLDIALGIGELIAPFINTIAAILIGGWIWIRTGNKFSGKKGKDMSKKLQEKLVKRLGTSFLAKLIPVIGSLFPIWTYSVYSELKSS